MKKLAILLLFFLVPIRADYKVDKFHLKNGLRIIFIEKKTVPIISLSIWYNCGSRCDDLSKSGVAHFLEHLAFLSNKKEFCEYLDDIGADKNAFTSVNAVCFHEIFNKVYLEKVLIQEAKRLRGLSIDHEVFINEKKAILEERGMTIDSDPEGIYQEILQANLFNRQAGGIDVIGWKHEIENIQGKDLQNFYKKWIVPNKATLILVGDFDLNLSKQLIEKYFGNIPEKKLLLKRTFEENKNYLPREIEYRSTKNGSLASAEYVYKVPFNPQNNLRKFLALSLAAEILDQPLFFIKGILKKMCDSVNSVNFSYKNFYQFSTFSVRFNTNSVDNLDFAEEMWPYFRKKLISEGIDEKSLNKIKKQNLISLAYQKEDIEKMSHYIGFLLTFGFSVEQIKSMDTIVQSITLKECDDVLKEIFSQKPMVIMRALPKGYDRD